MICEQCVADGLTSRVYVGPTSRTCMGFERYYDEKGNHHVHDPNISATGYRCVNGHKWSVKSTLRCPCGYQREIP